MTSSFIPSITYSEEPSSSVAAASNHRPLNLQPSLLDTSTLREFNSNHRPFRLLTQRPSLASSTASTPIGRESITAPLPNLSFRPLLIGSPAMPSGWSMGLLGSHPAARRVPPPASSSVAALSSAGPVDDVDVDARLRSHSLNHLASSADIYASASSSTSHFNSTSTAYRMNSAPPVPVHDSNGRQRSRSSRLTVGYDDAASSCPWGYTMDDARSTIVSGDGRPKRKTFYEEFKESFPTLVRENKDTAKRLSKAKATLSQTVSGSQSRQSQISGIITPMITIFIIIL
jgi:hypothetical protein